MPRQKALLFLVIAALLWSIGGLFIKLVDWHPLAIAGGRSLIAAIFISSILGKPKLRYNRLQFAAACAYTVTVTLFVAANKYTTAANSILIQYTAPIYVVILSPWLLKESITKKDVFFVALTIAGLVLFFLDDLTPGGMLGNIFALMSGVGFGLMAVLVRMQKDGEPAECIVLGNILTALIGLPFMFERPLDASGAAGLLILGVFQLGLSYYLYTIAIKTLTALDAILICMLEPLLNPVWVFLLIGERPGFWAFTGGAVVVFAVTARNFTGRGS